MRANGGRISVRFPPRYNYEGFSLIQFYGFTEPFSEFFSELPLPMSQLVAQTAILRVFRQWADFRQIPNHYNNEGFSLFQFYGFTELPQQYFSE